MLVRRAMARCRRRTGLSSVSARCAAFRSSVDFYRLVRAPCSGTPLRTATAAAKRRPQSSPGETSTKTRRVRPSPPTRNLVTGPFAKEPRPHRALHGSSSPRRQRPEPARSRHPRSRAVVSSRRRIHLALMLDQITSAWRSPPPLPADSRSAFPPGTPALAAPGTPSPQPARRTPRTAALHPGSSPASSGPAQLPYSLCAPPSDSRKACHHLVQDQQRPILPRNPSSALPGSLLPGQSFPAFPTTGSTITHAICLRMHRETPSRTPPDRCTAAPAYASPSPPAPPPNPESPASPRLTPPSPAAHQRARDSTPRT